MRLSRPREHPVSHLRPPHVRRPSQRAAGGSPCVPGDEFVVVLPDLAAAEGAVAVAEKLVACLREPFVIGGQELAVTSSMGIAVYPDDADDSAALQRRADERLYQTKRRGRDGYSVTSVVSA
jgi:diguanylate cyclase (GGDEF)-like protein